MGRMRMMMMVLLLASGAAAQERLLDADEARARAGAFLREGLAPLRPDLDREDIAGMEAIEVDDHGHGPAFDLLLRTEGEVLRLVVRVERGRGRIIYFSQPERDLIIRRLDDRREERPEAERAEELRARVIYDEAELRAKALAFLGHLVEGVATGERAFEVFDHRAERDGLVHDWFALREVPGPGVVACYSNLVQLDLNPETGEVVSLRRTERRHEFKDAPPVTAEQALAAARRAVPGAAAEAPTHEPELFVDVDADGRARLLWLVAFADAPDGAPRFAGIDAATGEAVRER